MTWNIKQGCLVDDCVCSVPPLCVLYLCHVTIFCSISIKSAHTLRKNSFYCLKRSDTSLTLLSAERAWNSNRESICQEISWNGRQKKSYGGGESTISYTCFVIENNFELTELNLLCCMLDDINLNKTFKFIFIREESCWLKLFWLLGISTVLL